MMRPHTSILIATLFLALLTTSTASNGEVLERLAAIEARVAALEAKLSTPPPPTMSLGVADFSFARLDVLDEGARYLRFVGEVTATRAYPRVTFRVTFYDPDGAIVATDRFSVENIGGDPRTFGNLVSGISASQVHSYRVEVDRVN